MKIKTRPKCTSRIPVCPRCGGKNWRRKGLQPTNTVGHASKGYYGPNDRRYHKAAMDRLFTKVYVCKNCKKTIRYGNAGRPIC